MKHMPEGGCPTLCYDIAEHKNLASTVLPGYWLSGTKISLHKCDCTCFVEGGAVGHVHNAAVQALVGVHLLVDLL